MQKNAQTLHDLTLFGLKRESNSFKEKTKMQKMQNIAQKNCENWVKYKEKMQKRQKMRKKCVRMHNFGNLKKCTNNVQACEKNAKCIPPSDWVVHEV